MKYYVEDYTERIEDAYSFKTKFRPTEIDWVAEDAAKDFYNNHDGWESTWPLTFVILDDEGIELGKYVVELEYKPSFIATKAGE